MAMAMLKEEAGLVMNWCISEISQMLHGTRGKSQYGKKDKPYRGSTRISAALEQAEAHGVVRDWCCKGLVL
jgi:DMSO/TMAO reductase YedYZ molybdopterin-dependent catalytic subunit